MRFSSIENLGPFTVERNDAGTLRTIATVDGAYAAGNGTLTITGSDGAAPTAIGSGIAATAGDGGDTANGGPITLTAGSGGATSGAGGAIGLVGGAGSGSDSGGTIALTAGSAGGVGGSGGGINLFAGAGAGGDGGGGILIFSGAGGATGAGGVLAFSAGTGGATSGVGGNIFLDAGSAAGGNSGGGFATFRGGASSGSGAGGACNFVGGAADTTGNGGAITLTGGAAGSAGGFGGSIDITPGGHTAGFVGGVNLRPPGTAAGETAELRFLELAATGANFTGWKAPDALPSNFVYTLPATAPLVNQVLTAGAVTATSLTWTTPAAAATQEVFFAATDYASDYQTDYRTRNIGAAGTFSFTFMVPLNFSTLTSLEMVFAPANNLTLAPAGPEFALTSSYGAVGESSIIHTESTTITAGSFTADEWSVQDISGVFSVLAAGDVCGIQWDNNGVTGGLDIVGIRLRYT